MCHGTEEDQSGFSIDPLFCRRKDEKEPVMTVVKSRVCALLKALLAMNMQGFQIIHKDRVELNARLRWLHPCTCARTSTLKLKNYSSSRILDELQHLYKCL